MPLKFCPNRIFKSDMVVCSLVDETHDVKNICPICDVERCNGVPTIDNLTPILKSVIKATELTEYTTAPELTEYTTAPELTGSTTTPGLIRSTVNYVGSTVSYIKDGLNDVSDEIFNERLKICQACEHNRGGRCGLCGCYIRDGLGLFSKLRRASSVCPDNPPRWSKQDANLPL